MPATSQKHLYWFIGAITIINLLQASFTELIYDEAYYWYFSTQLDWGYFDHPPMVAWMIGLGGLFFKGSLGVRVVGVLMSATTYLIIWNTISNQKKWNYINHFLVLIFSMTLLNAYGFFSLPDTPLLFFTALLFFLLKRFYEAESWILSVAIGLVMAALMYSKYHAVLVIFGVLFGYIKLLKNKKAWGAVGVSLLAYIPHLYWLYKHEFISVAYHLFERPNRAYDFFDFGLGYWVNLVAIFGFTFPYMYWALFKSKANSPIKKSMWGVISTVLIFFFISSFNRRIQTQWIIVICIPMAYLVFDVLINNQKLRRKIWITALINICLILFLRLGLIYEPILPISYEAHGNKSWTAALKKQVGDAKVIFEDSYRNAPMYAFYSGSKTHSLNSINYRQNQYTIDNSESEMEDEIIAYISKDSLEHDFAFSKTKKLKYYGKWIPKYKGISRLNTALIKISKDSIQLRINNPYERNISLEEFQIGVAFLNSYKEYEILSPIKIDTNTYNNKHSTIKPGGTVSLSGTLKLPENIKNFSFFKLSIAPRVGPYLLGGKTEKISQWNLN